METGFYSKLGENPSLVPGAGKLSCEVFRGEPEAGEMTT